MDRSPSILFLTADRFPPFRVDTVKLFAQELAQRFGYRVDWLMQSEAPLLEAEMVDWKGCRVWVGPTDTRESIWSRLHKRWLRWKHDLMLFPLSKRTRYDVIQVKDRYFGGLVGLLAAKVRKTRFVFWLSFPEAESSIYRAKIGVARYPRLYLMRGWAQKLLLYRILLRFSDHAFVQSQQMKRDVAAEGIDADKLTPVPMGIDIEEFDQLNQHGDTDFDEKTIVYLGTLASERRIDFLVRVLEIVLRRHPKAVLILIGGGDDPKDEQRIVEEAKRLGVLPSLQMTGRLERIDALRRVARGHVCVSPFYPTPILNSTSPTKLVEYMALRKAVVANDHPEQRLVIEASGGGICVPYQEQAFADAVNVLLDDAKRCSGMGKLGYEYVKQNRTYRAIAAHVHEKYTELLHAK